MDSTVIHTTRNFEQNLTDNVQINRFTICVRSPSVTPIQGKISWIPNFIDSFQQGSRPINCECRDLECDDAAEEGLGGDDREPEWAALLTFFMFHNKTFIDLFFFVDSKHYQTKFDYTHTEPERAEFIWLSSWLWTRWNLLDCLHSRPPEHCDSVRRSGILHHRSGGQNVYWLKSDRMFLVIPQSSFLEFPRPWSGPRGWPWRSWSRCCWRTRSGPCQTLRIYDNNIMNILLEVITDNWTHKFEPHGGQISKP